MSSIPKSISELIRELSAGGAWTIGEILVSPDQTLRHRDDAGRADSELTVHTWPEEAREIAKNDAAGAYRPLKSAPNLRSGWVLKLESAEDLRLALDSFYPAALGMFLSGLRGGLEPVPLRQTLGRQTGMYRITQLTRDDQADELIRRACNSESGCLRKLLWELSPGRAQPLTEPLDLRWPTREIPLLCVEACNLLVAACRPLGKSNLPVAQKPAEPAAGAQSPAA